MAKEIGGLIVDDSSYRMMLKAARRDLSIANYIHLLQHPTLSSHLLREWWQLRLPVDVDLLPCIDISQEGLQMHHHRRINVRCCIAVKGGGRNGKGRPLRQAVMIMCRVSDRFEIVW